MGSLGVGVGAGVGGTGAAPLRNDRNPFAMASALGTS